MAGWLDQVGIRISPLPTKLMSKLKLILTKVHKKMKLLLISTQVEVVVKVGLEKVLKINFHGWVGGWIKWE